MMKVLQLITLILLVPLSVFAQGGENITDSKRVNQQIFTGYLSDIRSAEMNNGVMMDGTDLKLTPEKNTVANMKLLYNVMSGYGLFVKGNDGRYRFYRFDRNGIALSKGLVNSTGKKAALMVQVKGYISDNVLYVETISEI